MQASPNAKFGAVEQRIQTLTSILQNMERRCSPTSNQGEIPVFLRHLTTLLTCSDKRDADAKKCIAVTGSLTAEALRTLVVTQNPFGSSIVSELGVERIMMSNVPFDEEVKK